MQLRKEEQRLERKFTALLSPAASATNDESFGFGDEVEPTTTEYASRAVQFHSDGGHFDFVWLPARTPHVGLSTCGEHNETKKNTHPKNVTARSREQAVRLADAGGDQQRSHRPGPGTRKCAA